MAPFVQEVLWSLEPFVTLPSEVPDTGLWFGVALDVDAQPGAEMTCTAVYGGGSFEVWMVAQ
jgi:hypothetical protein